MFRAPVVDKRVRWADLHCFVLEGESLWRHGGIAVVNWYIPVYQNGRRLVTYTFGKQKLGVFGTSPDPEFEIGWFGASIKWR